jgi:hypothetical protein
MTRCDSYNVAQIKIVNGADHSEAEELPAPSEDHLLPNHVVLMPDTEMAIDRAGNSIGRPSTILPQPANTQGLIQNYNANRIPLPTPADEDTEDDDRDDLDFWGGEDRHSQRGAGKSASDDEEMDDAEDEDDVEDAEDDDEDEDEDDMMVFGHP